MTTKDLLERNRCRVCGKKLSLEEEIACSEFPWGNLCSKCLSIADELKDGFVTLLLKRKQKLLKGDEG